jgi:hypothetical protein
LAQEERGSFCRMKHKDHMEKLMFLSAVGRLRFDENCVNNFDCKIVIWPPLFRKRWLVARNSINRRRSPGRLITMNLAVQSRCTQTN